jgi:Tol biopolymer transport system component
VTTGRQFIEAVGNVSPDGAWLYYHSDRAGDADLWRLPLAGGQPERLTTDSALDFAPAVSPDGREVAFHSLRHDRRDIYVLPVAGGPQVRVSVGEPQGGVPAWSPDGRAVAWLSGSAVRMARRNADGTWAAPRLVLAGYGPGGWAQWSPDGRWISYPMLAGLTLVDPATRSTRLLAGTVGLRWHVWSPDGGVIYGMRELDDQRIQMLAIPVGGRPARTIAWADRPLKQQARYGLALYRGRLYFPLVERSADVWVGDLVER